MSGTLHGELTQDGKHIVLLGAGEGYEQKRLGEVLKLITPGLRTTKAVLKIEGGVVAPITWPTVVQIAHTFNGNGNGYWVPGPRLKEWIAEQYEARQPRTDPFPLVLPGGCVPRDYQIDGARIGAHSGRFLLLDEPGCGKTLTTILALAWRQHLGTSIFPCIVVVPSWGVADGWAREIAKWIPEWRTELWSGPRRTELMGTSDVYLVTYATARRDAADMKGPLLKLKPHSVVADEIHWCANSKSLQTKAVQRISKNTDTFAGLSGTIIKQDVRGLWPSLKVMDHLSWPSGQRLTDRYAIKGHPDYGVAIEGLDPASEPEFRDTLLGSWRRVAKADVLNLPEKIYSVRRVKLPPDWRRTYDGMERDMLAECPDGQELPAFDVLSKMNALGRMASAAFDVEITEGPEVDELTGELKKHWHVNLKLPSWKVDELLEIMEERRGAAPVVTFADSRQLMMLAGQQAEKAGYRVGYYVGLGGAPNKIGPGYRITQKTRQKAFDDLDAGQLDLLCVTTKAGGTGLNLMAAGTAVFLRRPWEFDDSTQAEDRVHRLGSEIHAHGVEIIDIVAANTVDSRVRERLREKGANLAELVKDERIARELLGGL